MARAVKRRPPRRRATISKMEKVARPPGQSGRKMFTPAKEQRDLVQTMAGLGMTQEAIRLVIKGPDGEPIADKTLRKHFRVELDTGAVVANATVGNALYRQATDPKGGRAAVTAQIFWMKCRMGWKPIDGLQIIPPGLGELDYAQLSEDELDQFQALLLKARKPPAEP